MADLASGSGGRKASSTDLLGFSFNDFFCLGTRGKASFDGRSPLSGTQVYFPLPVSTELRRSVKTLGGEIATSVNEATHTVVPAGLQEHTLTTNQRLAQLLRWCQLEGKIVVEPSWVDDVASSDTWQVVLHDVHAPPILALLEPEDSASIKRSPPEAGVHPADVQLDWAAARSSRPPTSSPRSPRPRLVELASSLAETYSFLRSACGSESEELAKAIENSLLDFAIQLHVDRGDPPPHEDPCVVLGIAPGASVADIRASYRRLALKAHPDRGGSSAAFLALQRAYKRLIAEAAAHDSAACDSSYEAAMQGDVLAALPPAAAADVPLLHGPRADVELREHRALVEAWFAREGADLDAAVRAMELVLETLCLVVQDSGATNRNERGELLYNQCFYLSLSRAFLHRMLDVPDGPSVGETALHFKRVIEGAVLRAHPEWKDTQVGDNLQAFSDFLFFVLGASDGLLADLAVAVFDASSGAVEIFRGVLYPDQPSADANGRAARLDEQRANLLCLRYTPGHYTALVTDRGPTLRELLSTLDACEVRYVVTDG